MGNNIEDSMDTRWKVLESMLNEFPQLRDRTAQYLLMNPTNPKTDSAHREAPPVKELIQRALTQHQLERSQR